MKIQSILYAPAGSFARNDVSQIGHREDAFGNRAGFGIAIIFDTIWREYEVEIEGAILQLDKIFTSNDLLLGLVIEDKTQTAKSRNDFAAVLFRFRREDVHVLSRPGKPEKDGTAFAMKR
jgi:hypothetical protein